MVVWPVVVSCWLLWCPVWVLFLLFNIIDSSPVWFVSKKNDLLVPLARRGKTFVAGMVGPF